MNQEYKQDFLRAGQIAREVRTFGKSLIQKGASYNEVTEKIKQKILSLDAIPAFPPQIALNDTAAHFLPYPDEEILFSNELIKLDIGVCYQGAIGDCAVTIDLSGKYQQLIDAAEAALLAAEKIIKVGLPIREVGKIIETTIESYGLSPVRNLSGHGLGYYKIHTPPSIPNYDNGSNVLIKPGMTFAIEPFVTNGRGMIYQEGRPAIFSLIKMGRVRSVSTQTVLDKIKTFKGLPFAIHDLAFLPKFAEAVEELLQAGIIHGYPPLVEETRGWVAQAENSVLVDENGQVIITTR
jgi:methionyl aminopeptidase